MRTTTLLKKLLGIKQTIVKGFEVVAGALVIKVRPSWRKRRCARCRKIRPGFDRLGSRRWRHLDFGGVCIYLEYASRRVCCRSCGIVVEMVPWSDDPRSRFTTDFEESVGHLAQCCDKTSVRAESHVPFFLFNGRPPQLIPLPAHPNLSAVRPGPQVARREPGDIFPALAPRKREPLPYESKRRSRESHRYR